MQKLPICCWYFNREVVWGKYSGPLMWAEMGPGAEGLDARVFKIWSGDDAHSQTALIRACDRDAPVSHVLVLLAGGAALNNVDSWGQTAIYWACRDGREQVVRALLANRADPNIATGGGWTSLMSASFWNHSAVVSLLIHSAGATLSINHTNVHGETALMKACREHCVDCVRVLVANGVDIAVRGNQGQTALGIARRKGFQDIVHILEEAQTSNV